MPDKGSVIANRYHIVRLIGQGGMSEVFLAFDEILSRQVALKVLRPQIAQDPEAVVRFLREASAARRLHHPNVVDIYDVGESDGLNYIVMEYVAGQTLKQLVSQTGPMPARRAVQIVSDLADAMEEAHRNKIIHRDIKPQNVIVDRDGVVKITDFGIAVAADMQQADPANAVMGSAHYLAPESAAGRRPDYRVDIYSLGIVLFELLTGQVPFSGTNPPQIALKHMQDPLPSIRPYNETVSQGLENIVIKATAKNPDERYQSAYAFLDALDHAFDPDMEKAEKLVLKTNRLELEHVSDKKEPEPVVVEKKPPISHVSRTKTSWGMRVILALLIVSIISLSGFALISTDVLPISGWFGWHTMPAVTSLSLEEGMDLLAQAGLDPNKIVVEEVVSDSVDAGDIVAVSEKAGELVRDSETIHLQVSKGPSYLISDYTGQYLDDVQQRLKEDGVVVKYSISKQGAANTNPGIILSQDGLLPGERIDPDDGGTIEFVISAWPEVTITQDYIGMSTEEAKNRLNELGIAVIVKSEYGTGKVEKIDPPVGSRYTQEGTDSVVTLYD